MSPAGQAGDRAGGAAQPVQAIDRAVCPLPGFYGHVSDAAGAGVGQAGWDAAWA